MLAQTTKLSHLEILEGVMFVQLSLDVTAAGVKVASTPHRVPLNLEGEDVVIQLGPVNANIGSGGWPAISEADTTRIQAVFDVAKQHF